MTSRRNAIGVPLGMAAVVLLVVLASFTGGGSGAPARLPVHLAGSTGETADRAAASSYYAGPGYRLPDPLPPGLPGEARAGVLREKPAERAAVERLAAALGMSGEPARVPGGWQVVDGSVRLSVRDSAGNPWTYGPGADCPDTAVCAVPVPAPAVDLPLPVGRSGPGSTSGSGSGSGSASGTGAGSASPTKPSSPPSPCASPPEAPCPPADRAGQTDPVPPDCGPTPAGTCSSGCAPDEKCATICAVPPCPPGGACRDVACPPRPPLPDRGAALDAARRLLAAAGFTDVVLLADEGYDGWLVTGDVRVDGLRVLGYGLHAAFDGTNQPRSASGMLAAPEPGDVYPLLGVGAAVDRGRSSGGPEPAIACDANTPECTKLSEPRQVTRIELGLLPMSTRRETYLVPAWLLTVEGSTRPEAVVALADDYLAERAPHDDPGGNACSGDCDAPVSSDPGGGGEVPPDPGSGAGDGAGDGRGGGTSGSTGAPEPAPTKT